ncbi:MAG TPA: glycerophosphodiester phosphodiesterase [Alphaproteobacteria bacterium]|nr:glycerophosphodiester phosphodiesterase [Alphaproteobacteria bacterium]
MSKTIHIPQIIGHRGAKVNAPENTLVSIKKAHEEGATWVEFDVKLTSDGVPILIHDATLERTTNGQGEVCNRSLEDIRRLDAGRWFGPAFAGERVPTLAEALDFMAARGMGFNLEVKPCPGRARETAEVAARMVEERWPADCPAPIFSSFSLDSLDAVRKTAPDVALGYLVEKLPVDWRENAQTLGCAAIHPNHRYLSREQVREIKSAGYALLAWTVNETGRGRDLLAWGADSLITDCPGDLAAGLAL